MFISFDDGGKEEPRMASLLNRYGLKAIFFIPTCCKLSDDEIKDLAIKHEIGGHTSSHPEDMKKLTDRMQEAEIFNNKDWLEHLLLTRLKWFCYPGGRYNDITVKFVLRAGYEYARTTIVNKYEEPSLTTPTSVHIHPKSDWFNYAIRNWKKENFHIWGHTFELTKYNLWAKVEQFYEHIYNASK